MNGTSELVYAQINLDYDRRRILAELKEIEGTFTELCQAKSVLKKFHYLNQDFKLVDDQEYFDITVYDNETKEIVPGKYKGWFGRSLIDSQSLGRIDVNSSTGIRNHLLDDCLVSEDLKQTYLYQVINGLPFKKLYGARVVKLNPGDFAPIHRDNGAYNLPDQEGTTSNNNSNELWRQGKLRCLTLNISNGSTPLLFRYNGKILKASDSDYIFNDYYLHGVPIATKERYQIIISGYPSEDYDQLVIEEGAIYDRPAL